MEDWFVRSGKERSKAPEQGFIEEVLKLIPQDENSVTTFPCVIVYATGKHVSYIDPVLDFLDEALRAWGFQPQKLGDIVCSEEGYFDKIITLMKECVVGVVIFDGLRPNILFEYGLLKGMGKPVILLLGEGAEINVKTLYNNFTEVGFREQRQFDRMKNPRIELSRHFSDLGKHVNYFKWNSGKTDPQHISNVVRADLEKKKGDIIQEILRVIQKDSSFPQQSSEDILTPLTSILEIFFNKDIAQTPQLQSLYDTLKDVIQKNKTQFPRAVLKIVADAFYNQAIPLGETRDAEVPLKRAKEIYEIVLQQDSSLVQLWLKLGGVRWRLKDDVGAIEACEKALTLDPKLAHAWVYLGMARGRNGDMKGAEAAFERALTLNPKLASAWNGFGIIQSFKGDLKGAIEAYEKALALDPKFPPVWINLGIARSSLEDFTGAVLAYEQALTLDPKSAITWFNLGITRDRQGDQKGAIKAYEKALALDPRLMEAWNNLGATYVSLKKNAEALYCFEQCAALGGTSGQELARNMRSQGITPRAIKLPDS